MDEAASRHGVTSVNTRWDNTVAILTGDYLFARASEISADLGPDVCRLLARTIAVLCDGQIRDVASAGNWPLALVCVLASVIAAYAYLRVIVRMYFRRPAEDVEDDRSLFPQAVGIVLAAAVLVLGVFPRLLSSVIERASILRW
jgi:hypothetical protein